MDNKSGNIELSIKDQELLKKAILTVKSHLDQESFGVDDLTGELGISRSQMHRKLQQLTGLSATSFIRRIRLRQAFELLVDGKYRVSEIAYRVGFGSPAYFNKCFHDQYGFPPGDIHKQKTLTIKKEDIFDFPFVEKEVEQDHRSQGIQTSKPNPVKESKSLKYILAGVVLLIIILIGYFLTWTVTERTASLVKANSIAVLPFKNLSKDNSNQYFADGIMDAILMHLSNITDLRVISRTSVEQYRESLKTATQVGKELGVTHLLEGSALLDQNRIRIIVQLIQAEDDSHTWSQSYDRDIKDVFLIQSEIAIEIAKSLKAQIKPDEQNRIDQTPTYNLESYDYYQKGRFYFINYLLNRKIEDYRQSMFYYQECLTSDSTFAAAYAHMAELYWHKNFRGDYHKEDFMDSVRLLSEKALFFDPDLSYAHRMLGQYYLENGEPLKGIEELENAITLNPNNAVTYETLGYYYNSVGKWDYGIPYIFRSIELDPYTVFLPFRYCNIARGFLDLGNFENVNKYAQKAIDLAGNNQNTASYGYWLLAHTHLIQGNAQEAISAAESLSLIDEIAGLKIQAQIFCHLFKNCKRGVELYEELVQIDPEYFNYKHRYAYALWTIGQEKRARQIFDDQMRIFEKEIDFGRAGRNDPYYNLAGICAFLGDKDQAYNYLKKYTFSSGLEYYIERDPLFENLWEDDEFSKILDEVKKEKEGFRVKIKEYSEFD